jgi:hypothetical protein
MTIANIGHSVLHTPDSSIQLHIIINTNSLFTPKSVSFLVIVPIIKESNA